MPAKRKYRCLNPDCPGSGKRSCTGLFVAMNAPSPECPACGSMKLADWGEEPHGREGWCVTRAAAPGVADLVKHDDRTFRRIADRHGLTNMSNKDGKAIRVPKDVATGGPTHNFNGIEVPVAAKDQGGCINVPSMAQKLEGAWSGAGTPLAAMDKITPTTTKPNFQHMTNVVGVHKA